MKLSLEEFKEKILFNELASRFCSNEDYEKLLDSATRIYKFWKSEVPGNSSYSIFGRIAHQIHEYELLIELCVDLEKSKILGIDNLEGYKVIFKHNIGLGSKALKGLRPYVIEYTKNWSFERKEKDMNNEVLAPHLKGWYLTKP